jgi:glyoxalase family protein
MAARMKGIHHVTAISGDAQQNVDFYTGVLGMRLVKRSVNQDDPGTYHLFYADGAGHPGSDLTFFPWSRLAPARKGIGLTVEVALAVPPDSLSFWAERLEGAGTAPGVVETRFGERVLPFSDPHGLELTLVETADPREFTPWKMSNVPAERQIRGIHGVRLWERNRAATVEFLTETLGFTEVATEGDWTRLASAGGQSGEFVEIRELPMERRGEWGTGAVHHVAWRVEDGAAELEMRGRVAEAGRQPTPVIDRFWFESVYFMEPGGALFELATDGPGFTVDEDPATLGDRLVLPPWLERMREQIEAALPPIRVTTHETAVASD